MEKYKNVFIIFISKIIYFFIKLFNFGSGSTWPGHIALSLNKNFIKDLILRSRVKIILIAGTNGKTTTSTLIKFILESEGKKVFQNEEGANLLNGIASAIIKNSNFLGRLNYNYAVFEIDENTLPLVLEEIKPYIVLILNLFRDQLDRYGEVNTIALKWKEALKNLSKETNVILNADDPQVAFLGKKLNTKVDYFTIDQKMMMVSEHTHDVDSIYCPRCQTKLNYQLIAYSHLGRYVCSTCGFKNPESTSFSKNIQSYPLKGIYNIYNINAVILLLNKILKISFERINKVLNKFKPVFGRQEEINYQGRRMFFQLSKNPAGFNQSINVVKEMASKEKIHLLIILNDRIPDGRDVSWIWDVDFERIKDFHGYKSACLPARQGLTRIVVSGDRCLDMSLRLKYAEIDNKVEENLSQALEKVIKVTKKDERIVVLATYTGMLDVRKIIFGKKLL